MLDEFIQVDSRLVMKINAAQFAYYLNEVFCLTIFISYLNIQMYFYQFLKFLKND